MKIKNLCKNKKFISIMLISVVALSLVAMLPLFGHADEDNPAVDSSSKSENVVIPDTTSTPAAANNGTSVLTTTGVPTQNSTFYSNTITNDYNGQHEEKYFIIDMNDKLAGSTVGEFDPKKAITIDGDDALSLHEDSDGINNYAVAFYKEVDIDPETRTPTYSERMGDYDSFEFNKEYYVMIVLELSNGDYYPNIWGLASSKDYKISIQKNISCGEYTYKLYDGTADYNDNNNPCYAIMGGFRVSKPDPTLKSIEITKEPDQSEYFVGDSFDKTGMQVTAYYTDNTSKVVTDYTTSPEKFTEAGPQNVTVTYKEGDLSKTATQPVSVKERTPHEAKQFNIEMDIPEVGSSVNDFDSSKAITVTGDDALSLNPDQSGTNGYAVAFYTYNKDEGSYDRFKGQFTKEQQYAILIILRLNDGTYYSNEIGSLAKSSSFDVRNNFPANSYYLDDNMIVADSINIYYGINGSFTPKEQESKLDHIAITNEPDQSEYFVGDSFDKTGMEVTAYYTDDASQVVTDKCSFDPQTFTKAGPQDVTVTYKEGDVTTTAKQPVSVVNKHDANEFYIEMDIPEVGSSVEDYDSGSIKISGDDALSLNPDPSGTDGYAVAFYTYDESKTVERFNGQFEKDKPYLAFIILRLNDETYYPDSASHYYLANSESLYVWNSGPLSKYNLDQLSLKTLDVNPFYGTYGAFTPTEQEPELGHIEITRDPEKTEYNVGDSFDPSGMTVEATFSNKEMSENALEADFSATETVEVPVEDCVFTPEVFTTAGIQDVTVSYTYNNITKSDTVEVTVNESGNTPSDNPGQTSGASNSSSTNGSSITSTSKTSDVLPIALLALFSVVSAAVLIASCKKMQ